MYILYDKTNKDYVSRESNGNYSTVSQLNRAALFTTERGAKNIYINGNIPKTIMRTHKFDVLRVSTKKGKADKILLATEKPEKLFDFSAPEEIRKAADVLGRVMENKEALGVYLSTIDSEINDIQHFIETQPLNGAERSKLFKVLKEKLNERRLYKNMLEVIGTMSNSGMTEKVFVDTVASIEGLETKAYAPRSAFGEQLFKAKREG